MKHVAGLIAGTLLSAMCSIQTALSCGIEFPSELSLTQASDAFQPLFTEFLPSINRIAPMPDRLLPTDPRLQRERDSYGNFATPARADREYLETYSEPKLTAQVIAARAAKTPAQALVLAADIAPAHRFYLAGAVAFNAGDFAAALPYFEQAAMTPDAPPQALWARFMAGRSAARLGQSVRSAEHFQALRRAVEAGADDGLGLAFTSLGEEAKLHFDRLKAMANVRAADAPQKAVMREAVRRMLRLYLAQTAQERAVVQPYMSSTPGSGAESLRKVSVWLIDQPEILAASITDVWLQAVLSSFLLSRSTSGLANHDDATEFRTRFGRKIAARRRCLNFEQTALGRFDRLFGL
jgi:tetratricopeptide (TPR) repeat protein